MDLNLILEQLIGFLVFLSQKYPVLVTVMLAIGAFRLVFKNLTELARSITKATKTTKDDELLDQVEKSKGYKTVSYLLDLFASVKLPGKQ